MQLEEILEHSAARLPDKVALICGGRRLTYRELDDRANLFAASLIENGVQKGDRVAIYLDNSVDAVLAVFGVLKAGAVLVVVNPSTKKDKLAYLLTHSRAAALATDAGKLQSARDVCVESPHLKTVWLAGTLPEAWAGGARLISLSEILTASIGPERIPSPDKRCINLDLAAIVYTSGSTGRPKGVMATHLSLLSAADSITQYLKQSESDVILTVLPLSFSYGLYQMWVTFKSGGTLILERSFTYQFALLETMEREGVTGFAMVPTMVAILLQLNLQRFTLSKLRYITNAAAALPLDHISRLQKLWPHVRIYSMYGQTECVRISYLEPELLQLRPGSVGRGIPNQEAWLVDESGDPVPHGGTGMLVVRGAHVAAGYWDDAEATARTFRTGNFPGERILHTGDVFRTDRDGYLYFVARQDDIIKTRGEKVSPKEVEDAIYQLAGVAETAVFGVPDDILGQSVRAAVCLHEGSTLTALDVIRHCARQLEDFMVPKSVVLVPALPKNSHGKVNRRELGNSMNDRKDAA